MASKPSGFVGFIGWASVVVGLYYTLAPIYGAYYLVSRGSGSKAIVYVAPACLGLVLFLAGFALIKGQRWSRYLYLLLSLLALFPVVRSLPMLMVLFGGVADPAAKASLLWIASMVVSSAMWFVVSATLTLFVFRHFRASTPTLAELTRGRAGP
jgi:hypothetical protein